jgi:hypothetical protein
MLNQRKFMFIRERVDMEDRGIGARSWQRQDCFCFQQYPEGARGSVVG